MWCCLGVGRRLNAPSLLLRFAITLRQTVDSYYRKDLIKAATKKWSVLHQLRQCEEGKAMGLTQKTGRKIGGYGNK